MSSLQILSEQIHNNVFVVTVIGQMDESNIDDNSSVVYEVINQIPEGGSLILNFSELEYMNSKSIGYTTDFYNKMTEKKGKMIIAEAQEHIMDILTVVGLSHIISMVSSLSEAKAELGVTPESEEAFILQNNEKNQDSSNASSQDSSQAVESSVPNTQEDTSEKEENQPAVNNSQAKESSDIQTEGEGFSILTIALVLSAVIVLIALFV